MQQVTAPNSHERVPSELILVCFFCFVFFVPILGTHHKRSKSLVNVFTIATKNNNRTLTMSSKNVSSRVWLARLGWGGIRVVNAQHASMVWSVKYKRRSAVFYSYRTSYKVWRLLSLLLGTVMFLL